MSDRKKADRIDERGQLATFYDGDGDKLNVQWGGRPGVAFVITGELDDPDVAGVLLDREQLRSLIVLLERIRATL